MSDALLFEAVLFDLDGTLIATESFWPRAAREGARRAFAELGLEREIPTSADWMSLVGHPVAPGFERLFPDLSTTQRERVLELCIEEEHGAMRSRGVSLLPGVERTLIELRERGLHIGLASNCGQGYLDIALGELGLSQWIEEGRCLDSRGVHNKADMISDLLLTFDTRRAVMVGDRAADRDAAWANGLPHLHLAQGYATAGEEVAAEAALDGMDELVPRLQERRNWIEGEIEALAIAPGARVIGIGGAAGSGKTLFARDMVQLLGERGRPARALDLEDYRRGAAPDAGAGADPTSGEDAWGAADLATFLKRTYDLEVLVDRELREARKSPRAGELLVLEGAWLSHPRLFTSLDRLLWLDCSPDVAWRRLQGRELRIGGRPALDRRLEQEAPLQALLEQVHPPRARADRVLDASNALGPSSSGADRYRT